MPIESIVAVVKNLEEIRRSMAEQQNQQPKSMSNILDKLLLLINTSCNLEYDPSVSTKSNNIITLLKSLATAGSLTSIVDKINKSIAELELFIQHNSKQP